MKRQKKWRKKKSTTKRAHQTNFQSKLPFAIRCFFFVLFSMTVCVCVHDPNSMQLVRFVQFDKWKSHYFFSFISSPVFVSRFFLRGFGTRIGNCNLWKENVCTSGKGRESEWDIGKPGTRNLPPSLLRCRRKSETKAFFLNVDRKIIKIRF